MTTKNEPTNNAAGAAVWPRFDVKLRVDVDLRHLLYPVGSLREFARVANHEYMDLRRTTWRRAAELLNDEESILSDIDQDLADGRSFIDALSDAEYEFPLSADTAFDFGVASAVLTLNAAKCPTLFSWSGHGNDYPFVSFWCRAEAVPLLLEIAQLSGVGLINGSDGCVEVFSDDLRGLVRFARRLQANRLKFVALAQAGRGREQF